MGLMAAPATIRFTADRWRFTRWQGRNDTLYGDDGDDTLMVETATTS